jgi:hypothetical protein
MKWLWRTLKALLALSVLFLLLAAGGFFYSVHYIETPPVKDPATPLASWITPTESPAPVAAPWEIAARQHQYAPLDIAQFISPPLRFGPWTRWWWPGNLVTTNELQREMRLFAEVGIAGVEIQPFAISVSEADQDSVRWQKAGWDSPEFYQHLASVMMEARELGMGVDLNNGSGWPTGGPQVALEDGLRQLLHSERIVHGPSRANFELSAPAMPVATFGAGALGMLGNIPMQTFVPDARELVAVVAGRVTNNERSWQPWNFLDQVTLVPESVRVITDAVSENRLVWDVPPGEWAITTLWQLPGGELIAGGYAHPKPGYVVDHLDASRMRANQDYLFREATGLSPYFGNPLRAFFNDSLEFRQERHWARGQLDEFETRAGYDPRPWLAALLEPGKDQMLFHAVNIRTAPEYDLGDQGMRFLEDWDEVISDLFRERYFQTLKDWGTQRGLAHRLQAYGGPSDIIRAAGESDIPETEQLYAGGSEMFMKAVSSGAHIANKPLVSAESFIFLGRAFMTTPVKIKALADKAFAAGVNQLVYHGTAYRIEGSAERGYPVVDGWYPWQLGLLSTDYSENWAYWEHSEQINRYIARCQYLLRKGEPDTDVLVLYPGLGFPQGYSNPAEPFDQGRFEGEEALTEDTGDPAPGRGTKRMRSIWHETRSLEQQGLSWAWVNEHALSTATFNNGEIRAGSLRAGNLMLHDVDAMAPDVAEHIATLKKAGLPVRVSGIAPHRQRGLLDSDEGDVRVQRVFNDSTANVGFIPEATMFQHPQIKSVRRRLTDGGLIQFFSNPTAQATTLTLQLGSQYSQAVWLDAWHGKVIPIKIENNADASIEIPAYGSIFLWLDPEKSMDFVPHSFEAIQTTPLKDWSLQVARADIQTAGELPGDWLLIPELRSSGGPGIYSTTFTMPADIEARLQQGHDFQLNLNQLFGAATVFLNGTQVGTALVPPYSVNLTAALKGGHNRLEVKLTPPRKNRLVSAIEDSEPGWNAPDIVGTSARVSAGLIGPAQIIESAPIAQ